MTTKNKRVVGYIEPTDHDRLRQFIKEFSCTESKAIALILHSYFSGTPVSTPASRINDAHSSILNDTLDTNNVLARLKALEDKLEALSGTLGSTPKSNQLIEEAIARQMLSSLGGVSHYRDENQTLTHQLNETESPDDYQALAARLHSSEAERDSLRASLEEARSQTPGIPTLPDAAELLQRLRAKMPKSKASLKDVEAILSELVPER